MGERPFNPNAPPIARLSGVTRLGLTSGEECFLLRPVVIGIDDTLERRGEKITAKGIYRDPVRSLRSHVAKASGLRWLCAMLLAEIPGAGQIWALPFLTVLCPSECYRQQRGQRHKALPEWPGNSLGCCIAGCCSGRWS